MTEMRISEVEIISMLIPASNSEVNSFAVTPALERIPAPTTESLPIWSSCERESKPTSSFSALSAVIAVCASDFGSVNEMSVRPLADDEFCTIMSMFAPVLATIVKMRAALPGMSGTPITVTFAWLRSAATPVMIGSSTFSPSVGLTTSVPSLLLNELRTCSSTP